MEQSTMTSPGAMSCLCSRTLDSNQGGDGSLCTSGVLQSAMTMLLNLACLYYGHAIMCLDSVLEHAMCCDLLCRKRGHAFRE